jgi:hypothetical protein
MVAMSVVVPSMMRPPCCGFSVAAAVADGAEVPAGVPWPQAVATRTAAAKTATRALPVR